MKSGAMQGLMILQIIKIRLDKIEYKIIQTPPNKENFSIGIDPNPGATANAWGQAMNLSF